ncbi:MAG: RIP metalloprotease RseP [Clostridia bacterium]|nr:RIP metalloprotease RseP [Clostridia bacterium]
MIWTVLFALLIFSLIIFVHELGHFLSARIFGVKVHEFAIGMGPKIFSKTKGETKYSIRAIPIGGFCSMEGEDEKSDDEGSFSGKPWYQKLIILAAGALMNVFLGFIISVIFVAFSSANSGISTVTVDSVLEQSPLYGFLQQGDEVLKINGKSVNIKRDIDFAMQQANGEDCEITIKRDGEVLTKKFKPLAAKYTDGTPAFMIGFIPVIEKATVFNVVREGFYQTIWMGKLVFVSLGMLIGGQAQVSDVSGPVGVVDAMNTQAQTGGFIALLYLAGFISVNIGIMNLLPIPALDGGRIFFVLIEAIRRKPIPPEKEGIVHFIGLVLLMGIMVFATWNDILRLINH